MLKEIVKSVASLMAILVVSPLLLSYFLLGTVFNKDQLLATHSQILSLLPGKTGAYFRTAFYRFALNKCESNAFIGFATILSQQDTDIAAGVYIGPQCNIGKCSIGKDTLLGSGVHIMSGKGQHVFEDVDTPIREQGGVFTKISVGQNCWIGNGALLLANVGDNCIIAAGAVVVNDVPSKSIMGGNPAKLLKTRD